MSSFQPPPFAIPEGQSLVYCYAGTYSSSVGNSCIATCTTNTGYNFQGGSSPLGNNFSQNDWSNFYVPPVLYTPGTVVHGIYGYVVFNGSFTQTVLIGHICGTLFTTGLTSPFNTARYYNMNTTNLSVIPTYTGQVYTEGTAPIGPTGDYINTTFIGVAVYATIPYHPPHIRLNVGVGGSISS